MTTRKDKAPVTSNFDMDSEVEDSLLTSPAKSLPPKKTISGFPQTVPSRSNGRAGRSNSGTDATYEEHLRKELASVRKVNEAIESVLESFERAKNNMKTVNHTVNAASSLLNIWTRILSQTEHNQRLVLDPSWQGASQDIQDIEDEAQARQRDAERREAQEQERREAVARKAEDDERKRAEATNKLRATTRGRSTLGRSGSTRTASSTQNTSNGSSRGLSSSRRAGSNIGRGVRGTRGRG